MIFGLFKTMYFFILHFEVRNLGYKNCPYIAIRHTDRLHDHVHIIASRITHAGEKERISLGEWEFGDRSKLLSFHPVMNYHYLDQKNQLQQKLMSKISFSFDIEIPEIQKPTR